MSFKLKIKFTGLCGFVPMRPIEGQNDQKYNEVEVLLVDGRHGGYEPHFPVIVGEEDVNYGPQLYTRDRLPHRYVTKPDTEPTADARKKGPSAPKVEQHWVYYELARETLLIRPGGGYAKRYSLHTVWNEGKAYESLRWLAPMEQATPDSGEVDPGCMERPPSSDALRASMLLTEGELRTAKIASYLDRKHITWEFKPARDPNAAPTLCQELADVIELSLEVDAPFVEIESVGWGDGGSPSSSFIVIPAKNAGEVTLWIKNMPTEDIEERRKQDAPRPHYDFEMLYGFSRCAGNRAVPFPRPSAQVSNPQCPPSIFRPPSA